MYITIGITQSVSTHSRPKAADNGDAPDLLRSIVSTHSRPKAAEFALIIATAVFDVSTHSRPKAAEFVLKRMRNEKVRFNTQPPEGG